ncbi:hypothetical protein SUNI508_01461 [Seiridium unicorne]|uniref:Uncharacterized protein n=1 Tax=Seiridium unicorne TaxID=138068 RepID=A0ABR2UTP0_9PEZI
MPFRKYRVDPERKHGNLKVVLSISETLYLSDPDAELILTIAVGFDLQPPSYEGHAITICTEESIFDVFEIGEPGADMFTHGAFHPLWSIILKKDNSISLGLFGVLDQDVIDSEGLRERGYRFVTIPGGGSSIVITYRPSWECIFRHADGPTQETLVTGEEFCIEINSEYLETKWWCWDDLESILKDKKFHVWRPPYDLDEKPDDEFLRNGN